MLAMVAMLVGGAAGCESCLKRQPRDSVPLLPYPSCPRAAAGTAGTAATAGTAGTAGANAGDDEVLAEQTLRAGPTYPTPDLLETYRIVRRGCLIVATVRQQWSRQIDDVEVVYDTHFRPLRAWKRMSVPGIGGRSPLVDTRRYELRGMPIAMTARNEDGTRNYVFRRRERPVAVIGPGRGLVTAWIRAHHLVPNEVIRGPVLDFRALVEKIDTVALRREDDRVEPTLGGRRLRVYTIFGRESLLVDEHDTVIGDLAGLRPAESVAGPVPPLLETESAPDPVGTP